MIEHRKTFNGKIYNYWAAYKDKVRAEREVERIRDTGMPARLFYDKQGYKNSGWSDDYQPWVIYTYGKVK